MILNLFSPYQKRSAAGFGALCLLFWRMPLRADAPENPGDAQSTTQPLLTSDQLETLVAPVALYPDELLTQILVASTYPLEIVQAYQWLQIHPELKGQDLTQAAAQQTWDPSVQALVAFPDVLKRLNQDINWTTNLGNQFLASQANLMEAVQRMRQKAQGAGKLNSTAQEKVTTVNQSGQPVIEIAPASPDVVYVPVYDPAWVWGPPAYYYYPAWYYPPRPAYGGYYVWGGGISMSVSYSNWNGWGGWGWQPGWSNHTVVVNNTFIVQNHYNTVNVGASSAGGAPVPAATPALNASAPAPTAANMTNPTTTPKAAATSSPAANATPVAPSAASPAAGAVGSSGPSGSKSPSASPAQPPTSVWTHNPAHRLGVAYPTPALSKRFAAASRRSAPHPVKPQAAGPKKTGTSANHNKKKPKPPHPAKNHPPKHKKNNSTNQQPY